MRPTRRRRSAARTAYLSIRVLALCGAAVAASTPAALASTPSPTLALVASSPAGAAAKGLSMHVRVNGTANVDLGGGLVVELAARNVTASAVRTGALIEAMPSLKASFPTGLLRPSAPSASARTNGSSTMEKTSTGSERGTTRSAASTAAQASLPFSSTTTPRPSSTRSHNSIIAAQSTVSQTYIANFTVSHTPLHNSTPLSLTSTRTGTLQSTLPASHKSTSSITRFATTHTRTSTSKDSSANSHTKSTTSRTKGATSRTKSATRSRSSAIASTRSTKRVSTSSSTTGVVSASRSRTSASATPSPTRYGAAPTKGCRKPPATFAGTDAGFATLCKVRYCDAVPRRNMAWSGNSGNVTREEIESALGMLRELEPVWENGLGNVLADGWLGQGSYDAGLLYEITGDRRALDVIVNIADNILALQNPNTKGGGVTIWTGAKDSVWPTSELHPEDGRLVYAGCEQGLIVGNMVAAAVFILKSPCLWDMVPPAFDGPTVFDKSTTYYERALAYIAAGDDTYESFFWRFLDSNLNLINPADDRWWQTGDTRAPGTPMPWNRGMMMMHGYLRLAAAHETDAAFNANTTAYYDRIVQRHISNFVRDLNETKALRNGVTTFNWDYSYGEDHTEESQGVHAYYDIWGSWIGWQRNSAVFGLSNFIGKTFADTFENTIAFGNGSFSGLVTGSSTSKAYTINRLWGGWSFYALWLPEWFDTVATANVEVGFSGRTWLAIPLLWTKHALAMNDLTFWSSRFSTGFGVIVGTDVGASMSTSSRSGLISGAASVGATTVTYSVVVAAVVLLVAAASAWA